MRHLFIAVPLMSFSMLLFEIAITRAFSILYDYHYSFLAVTLAFSGLGLGAFLYESKIKSRQFENTLITLTGAIFSLSVTILVYLSTMWPSIGNFYIIISFSIFINLNYS